MTDMERYAQLGADEMGDADLIALILGGGAAGRSGLAIAAELVERFDDLSGLADAPVQAIAAVRGIGPGRAARLHAGLELGRRVARQPRFDPITTPMEAWRTFESLGLLRYEELHAAYLDKKRRPIGRRRLTLGSDGFTVVDPRQVYRYAVAMGAHGVLLAHNHPSGDPTPSPQDREVTRRVAAAGRVLGVPLLDHLVIVYGGYTSLASEGELPIWSAEPVIWTADNR